MTSAARHRWQAVGTVHRMSSFPFWAFQEYPLEPANRPAHPMSTAVWILCVIFTFIFFMRWMEMMAKDRQTRMKLLEEAVKAGNLDDDGRHELLAAVTGRKVRHIKKATPVAPSPHRATKLERLFLFVGWMGFLVGVALFVVGIFNRYDDDVMIGGIVTGLAGFAFLTYPFVIRELESRGSARATTR